MFFLLVLFFLLVYKICFIWMSWNIFFMFIFLKCKWGDSNEVVVLFVFLWFFEYLSNGLLMNVVKVLFVLFYLGDYVRASSVLFFFFDLFLNISVLYGYLDVLFEGVKMMRSVNF